MDKSSFQEIFLRSLKGPLGDLLGLESEAIASFYMGQSPIQDPFRYRAKYMGLRVASLLLDEKGELISASLDELNRLFARGTFVLGPGREGDVLIFSHLKNCLQLLSEQNEIWASIRKFSIPLCNKKAEEVVKETLWPEPIRVLQTVHVRKAVIAAWLTLLRQSTGSCFATAPAILVQQTEPFQFFKDLYDLLSIGQMKRVFGGKEYSVPLSFSSGAGDLQKGVTKPFFGLSVALDAVSVKLTHEKMRGLTPQSVERMLRTILMEDAGLTEEDLRDEEHLARIQMTPLLVKQGAVYFQRPSERAQRVADWKKRFEKACISFKSITECSLLRSWEYSLASFCDVKTDFARWNLYIGLGIHPDQQNGIGSFLYGLVNEHLQKCHAEIERLSREYEVEIGAIQAIEVMIQGAVSEMRVAQLKADWMSRSASANTLIEMRSRMIARADGLVGLFAWLIERYDEKLQEYFQELFDPELVRESESLYEDSPAGFRLVYKHGRADASQWTSIHTNDEYIEALRDFFSRMEDELEPPQPIGKELIAELTTALIQFIRGDEFLEWAFVRSKEKGRLSPWHYISGGTLQTLLMAYRNRDRPFTEKRLVPHSEEQLFQFFTGLEGKGPFLCHSPTHAFIFYPELANKIPLTKKPFHSQKWTEAMQEHIAHKLSEKLPEEERDLLLHLLRQKTAAGSNAQFRLFLLEAVSPRIKHREALIDSVLYENAILFNPVQAQEALGQILGRSVVKPEGSFFGPFDLYELAKMAVVQSEKRVLFDENWDQKIALAMRKRGLLPEAILFADTNWSNWFFGFVQNPLSGRLELWRLNQTATQGYPMTDWKEWMHLQNTSSWIILSKPNEYTGID